ncbi:MAG: polymer-forming cytoskeletal protein [Candidatus Methanosuratincola sp.]
MRIENKKIEGDIKIAEELTVNGTITGSAVVSNGGKLILNGIVNQDVILERGSYVEIYGEVEGNIHNHGGELKLYGKLNGSLYKDSGVIVIYHNAVIKGKIY